MQALAFVANSSSCKTNKQTDETKQQTGTFVLVLFCFVLVLFGLVVKWVPVCSSAPSTAETDELV